jgi:hypothetical protein
MEVFLWLEIESEFTLTHNLNFFFSSPVKLLSIGPLFTESVSSTFTPFTVIKLLFAKSTSLMSLAPVPAELPFAVEHSFAGGSAFTGLTVFCHICC